MDSIVASCLASLRLEGGNVFGRMEVIPVFAGPAGDGEYISLSRALAEGLLRVTEVGKEGTVPELSVRNKGRVPVLLVDGEELAGAKQNRVLNTTILVPGESEIVIPVSCTEQGRWSYTSPHFEDSRTVMAYKVRTKKMAYVAMSMKRGMSRRSDQSEIWDEIKELGDKMHIASRTGAMRDIFSAYEEKMREYVDAFPLVPGQQGILVYIDGRPAGLELVSRPDVYADLHGKLVKSYVIEVLADGDAPPEKSPAGERPADFLRRVASLPGDAYPGVGLGTEHRFGGDGLVGSALVHWDAVVHLACFAGEPGPTPRDGGRIAGYRARRAHAARGRGTRGGPGDGVIIH
ncbi:MAG: hypothetical protein QFX32_05980 [Methanolinea sp.]|nr:hypothetical protein [Methanolinea sp.]